MEYEGFIWMHIKKSAGTSTRQYLQPHYQIVDKIKKPKCFIQANKEEYNDILNNYRVVLGEYQFKRALFAKTFLYKDSWERKFSFAFSREPIERCISMFHYLCYRNTHLLPIFAKNTPSDSQVEASYAFDTFLDYLLESNQSDSIYSPIDNHFTTHTNPMWDDVTDESGNILLTKIFRIENIKDGINQVYEACKIDTRIDDLDYRINTRNTDVNKYKPSPEQIKKIEEIFNHDFDIYENAE